LIDMTMMRIRGVWTTNASAFLLGAGMYASFIVIPQIAQLPKSTGFGFGASVVVSGLYLLPLTIGMTILGLSAGRISGRYGSRSALLVGTAFTTVSFALLAVAHNHPYDLLIAAALLGVGVGLAFAALGNLIVQAVSPEQTGVASGMNTVMRTLGGALGGQLSATFIAANTANGLPTIKGFTDTFLMATGFLLVCLATGFLVPKERGAGAADFSHEEATGGAPAAEGATGYTWPWLFGVGPVRAAHHAIAVLGLGSANRDDVQSIRAGLERTHDLGRHAHHVPLAKLEQLVVQQHASGTRDDQVGLLLLAVTVGHWTAHVRRITEKADPEVTRVEVFASEAAFDARNSLADRVLDLQQVHGGVARHWFSSVGLDGELDVNHSSRSGC
jgi:hypothetical protein